MDGQKYMTNSGFDLFKLIDYNFSSSFKVFSKRNSKIFECQHR